MCGIAAPSGLGRAETASATGPQHSLCHRNYRAVTNGGLSNRRSNPARLKNVKFPVFIVSPLEIRQYIGVPKLQKRKNFLFLRSKSFCRSFFCAGKREIGHKAYRLWLMNAMPHGKRDERNPTVFDRPLLKHSVHIQTRLKGPVNGAL